HVITDDRGPPVVGVVVVRAVNTAMQPLASFRTSRRSCSRRQRSARRPGRARGIGLRACLGAAALTGAPPVLGFFDVGKPPMPSIRAVALPIAGVLFAALHCNCVRAEIRVQGPADDVRVEARDATVADILAALGERFALRYRGATGG